MIIFKKKERKRIIFYSDQVLSLSCLYVVLTTWQIGHLHAQLVNVLMDKA